MKLLFDQNISFRIKRKLPIEFQNCKHVSDLDLQNTEDYIIWEYAKANDLSIVTFDQDFFEISLLNGTPPKIIWIKSGKLTTNEIANLLIEHWKSIQDFVSNIDYNDLACLELE